MTNTLTISREQLERWLVELKSSTAYATRKELQSILSAPAVERQEEWAYCPECGCKDLHHEQGEHKQCGNCYQEWFSDIDYSEVVRGNLEKLKASPPAPVAVVLPERMEVPDFIAETQTAQDNRQEIGEALGHNACLDKVKEMNRGQV